MKTNIYYYIGAAIFLFSNRQGCYFQNAAPASLQNETFTLAAKPDTSVNDQLIDTVLYNKKIQELANGDKTGYWPVKTSYPRQGALLPFNRIIAYYGNFYSANMGVLGEYPEEQLVEKLNKEKEAWEMADSLTPVLPAIQYIVVTAQKSSGRDSKHRLRMPYGQVDKALALAEKVNGILILDVQVGLSTLKSEIPLLKKYLSRPNVHLAIDPEFSMKNGKEPGTAIGTFDAEDINYASEYLSSLVNEYKLPPKILVVHRFTIPMLSNYKNIKTTDNVQLLINMDGFGTPALKRQTYYYTIYREPVQFAGFKLFYKVDVKTGKRLMTPEEILKLKPQPIYIQYQ